MLCRNILGLIDNFTVVLTSWFYPPCWQWHYCGKDKAFLNHLFELLSDKFSNATVFNIFPYKQLAMHIINKPLHSKEGFGFSAAFFSESCKSSPKSVFSPKINTKLSSYLKTNLWFNANLCIHLYWVWLGWS